MSTYYTAKDIEELAAKGVQQLEIGPGVTLTDFARESAQQLGISLVDAQSQAAPVPAVQPTSPSSTPSSNSKFNKPSGCMHGSTFPPAAASPAADVSSQLVEGADSNTVNRLIDLMGKVIKRGE